MILERLEDRIAPAIINAGPADISGSVQYDSTNTPFIDTDSAEAIAQNINGIFSTATDDYYYLALKAGDTLKIYNSSQGAGFEDFITVKSGEIIAYFFDKNNSGDVDADELTGLSLGKGANVIVRGSVDGDIISNYDATTDTLSPTSLMSDLQTIVGLNISGSVNGRVAAAGSISNVIIAGNVEQINVGSAVGAYTYDFGGTGGDAGVGEATLSLFTPGLRKAGASISNVSVGSLDDPNDIAGYGKIVASEGGAGGLGGSLTNITIQADANGFSLLAGDGGDGISTSIGGGAGGKITTVYVKGIADTNSDDLITIHAGDGGTGYTDGIKIYGAGGAGGALDKIYLGYELNSAKKIVRSTLLLQDQVLLAAGDGGDGRTGGAGGLVSNIKIAVSTDDIIGVDEVVVHAGDGGAAFDVAGARGGAGGKMTGIDVGNFNDTALDATILIDAGDGGNGGTLGAGGVGGAITTTTLLGYGFSVHAGLGGDAWTTGGAGGSITSVVAQNLGNILASQVEILAGDGGDSTNGAAGLGGSVTTVTLTAADIGAGNLIVSAGDGGTSLFAAGGRGGSLQTVKIIDAVDSANSGTATFLAGNGGDGGTTGGIAGNVVQVTLSALNASAVVTAGMGGDSTLKGAGGAGGYLSKIGVAVSKSVGSSTIIATAGGGGSAANKANGGLGGYIMGSNFQADGDVSVIAGDGGAGSGGGTSGAGGYIKTTGASSSGSDVTVEAGDGGSLGLGAAKGGNGGLIDGVNATAFWDVTLEAGDGTGGGSGGNLQKVVYGGGSFGSAPYGDILIRAGDGSSMGATSGIGGSITTLTGYASGNSFTTTTIKAGDGGGGDKGAKGGSITTLTILGGASDALMTIWAGEGGDAAVSGAGGAGGSISGVSIAGDIQLGNLLAGDGGDATAGAGGIGGSITKVYTWGDIGYRSGKTFGFTATDVNDPSTWYSEMGGIFAGLGGTGKNGIVAKAGSVTSITADAISSIVAGKYLDSPGLVYNVDQIYLNGFNAPKVDAGATVSPLDDFYTNWDSANFVGGIAGDPTAPGATIFETSTGQWTATDEWVISVTKPSDGLIAALTLGSKRNFSPTAFLSLTKTGETQFAGTRVPTT